MVSVGASPENNTVRANFLGDLFGDATGLLCLAAKEKANWKQEFFRWPNELPLILNHISNSAFGRDVYFCVNLLTEPRKEKPYAMPSRALWADLDTCKPSVITPAPSIVMQTSPTIGDAEPRYQAYWLLKESIPPEEAEDICHRIAFAHKLQGADSGWALGKMLRLPNTYNMKHATMQPVPIIRLLEDQSPHTLYKQSDFAHFAAVPGYEYMDDVLPPEVSTLTSEVLLAQYKTRLDPRAFQLFEVPPNGQSWSESLWNLECLCIEAGMVPAEAFVVARDSACNKYARDNRPMISLWREVCKAAASTSKKDILFETGPTILLPPLLTSQERNSIKKDTFVDRFTDWARSRTDAPVPYHEVGAFVILSTLLASRVHLPTSWGTIVPNLWVMLLGPSTIGRKTTALRLAKQLLLSVDEDAILATDGSLEGIMTAMQTRPGKASIFFKDEFSGFLAQATRKEYMAGILEMFTFLYDSDHFKRVLRSTTIEVRNPTLILFCGGVNTEILQHLSREHITSGFAARFLYVDAEIPSIDSLRPMGPPTRTQDEVRGKLEAELGSLLKRYDAEIVMTFNTGGKQATQRSRRVWDAELTPETWDRYNDLERLMLKSAITSEMQELYVPMLDRLSKSILKCAVLLAAARQDPGKTLTVTVELHDLLKAIYYGEKWREYTVYITENAGSTQIERKLGAIHNMIKNVPGISRGRVMTAFKLNSREVELVLDTLEQRTLIRRERHGKAEKLYDPAFRP